MCDLNYVYLNLWEIFVLVDVAVVFCIAACRWQCLHDEQTVFLLTTAPGLLPELCSNVVIEPM